jgi:hypothetical protein
VAALLRRTHPHVGTRATALTDNGPLLRQGFAFSFALGACFSLSMDAATSLTGQVRQNAFYWPAEAFVVVLTTALGIRALRAAAHTDATGNTGGGLRARLGLTAGLPAGWALAPSRMSDHAMVPFPVALQLAALLVLAAAGWLLGLWVERVMAAWAPRVSAARHPVRTAAVPIACVVLVVLLAARTVYETQYMVIIAHLTQTPPVAGPVPLALIVAHMYLYTHFVIAGSLPLTVALLMIPLAGRRSRTAGGPAAPAGRRPGRVAVAAIVAGVLALRYAVDLWSAVDRAQQLSRPTGTDLIALGCGFGAGAAAAVAVCARRAPVTKGVLAALVAGALYLALLAASLPMTGKLSTFVLGQVLEAGLLAALVTSGLRHLWSAAQRKPAAAGSDAVLPQRQEGP